MSKQQALPGFPKTRYQNKAVRTGKPLYANRINLKGRRFDRLIALRDVGKNKHGRRLWECECDCGNITVVSTSDLIQSHNKSCGCLSEEKRIFVIKGNSNLNIVLNYYKQGARRREYEWLLTDEEAIKLFKGNCFYCGQPPSNIKNEAQGAPFVWNGIDRKVSSSNYSLGNCVSCCTECNYFKRDKSARGFLESVMRIAEYQLSKT